MLRFHFTSCRQFCRGRWSGRCCTGWQTRGHRRKQAHRPPTRRTDHTRSLWQMSSSLSWKLHFRKWYFRWRWNIFLYECIYLLPSCYCPGQQWPAMKHFFTFDKHDHNWGCSLYCCCFCCCCWWWWWWLHLGQSLPLTTYSFAAALAALSLPRSI